MQGIQSVSPAVKVSLPGAQGSHELPALYLPGEQSEHSTAPVPVTLGHEIQVVCPLLG